ncbi:MAG: UDP-N-acetylglucosamine--N-acetylmuramyl-(pentapeptide) pyrophosphoryl-undecaprenol N-acetylglucosamine transferase [Solirubrobacteraceae bacterium MAG38_C4-C5]|nr:UDP-N-acetylglucosamine--N-acetylmuramyl-(pentapeptide) pyrophosphoryl-undecaprenol N-acetylglucosamine transferase [Candidatus Siliceabacter maunaloa]
MTDADHLTRVIVTGGGSGGHAMPALAAITRLLAEPAVEVEYIGSTTGIERAVARGAGVPFHAVRTGKLRRARRWYGVLSRRNAADVLEVVRGTVESFALLGRLRPSVVLATGGFVTVPVAWAACLRRIPVVIHEQTLRLGLANRLCAPAATGIVLSTPLSYDALRPRWRSKATVTGNPVRTGVLKGVRSRAVDRFALAPDLPTILVTGGALGAMGDAYAIASLVVSRSGAGTTNELAATGRPALLVPLVPTGGDEQCRIARSFAAAGAALVVQDDAFSGTRLVAETRQLLAAPDRLAAMGTAAASLAPGDAAGALADLVLRTARRTQAVHSPGDDERRTLSAPQSRCYGD